MKSTAVESTTTKSASVETTAIMETASHAATVETARYAAAMETASSEAATAKAATMETATAAAKATAAPMAASTSTAATSTASSQRHRRRNQANGRNCQQRDHCLTQHDHSPSEISLPTSTVLWRWESFWRIANSFDESVTQLSASHALIKFKFSERLSQGARDASRISNWWKFVTRRILHTSALMLSQSRTAPA
jgi:hypothetical protein